jgi:hypothetical protein
MKSFKSLLSVAVLCVALAATAEAKTKVISDPLESGDIGFFFHGVAKNKSFSDTLKFTLAGPSNILGVLDLLFIKPSSFSALLTGPGSFSQSFSPGVFHFDDLSGGDYTMTFAGQTYKKFGGAYASLFKVTAAVPEADTWLMIVIGAGLVLFQLRRKQKSLQHRPLAAI